MPTDSPPKHIIRPATRADSPDLARLLTLLGHHSTEQGIVGLWPEWAAQGNVALVATTASGKVRGLVTLHSMLVLHRPKPVGRITALIVDAATRGSGIGRALLNAA